MKKYIIKKNIRGMFSLNEENDDIDVIDYMRTNIDYCYLVPEDGELIVNGDTKKVKKNDIIIQFYPSEARPNLVTVVRSKEWKENIASEHKYYEEQEKKLASAKSDCCQCCDSACECACQA